MRIILLITILLLGSPSVYATSYAKLHLNLVGDEMMEGHNATFSGVLTNIDGTPLPHHTIFIEDDMPYTQPDIILAIAKTDSDGKFIAYWKAAPKDDGTPFNFYALFIGGNLYGYTRSETYESVVKSSNQSSTDVVPSKTMPSWFKDASKLWHDGQIRNVDYSYGIKNLIDYGIIKTNGTSDSISYLPLWLRNAAGWWADGQISNEEFESSLEYLINNQNSNIRSES